MKEGVLYPQAGYPRPGFVRAEWMSLDGEWEFGFDDLFCGEREEWYLRTLPRRIQVPFAYQCERSGIGETAPHACVWYRRTVALPAQGAGTRWLLHFGAVDYSCRVWVNGRFAGGHRGGHVPFSFDVTSLLLSGENTIAVKAEDRFLREQPRGKQAPVLPPDRCWYVNTTGIWQSVWLEPVPETYLEKVRITPDIDARTVSIDARIGGSGSGIFSGEVSFHGETAAVFSVRAQDGRASVILPLAEPDFVDEVHYWTPETPNLYDAALSLQTENGEDAVSTYFGMRSLTAENGVLYLNHRPYYERLVLDQGYWRESLMTPPDPGALRRDVEAIKAMGFNGARKHQKIEAPAFYYWADRLGLLVWAEMPSPYAFCPEEVQMLTQEWLEAVDCLYNHPCIVTWVPFNESWGIRNVRDDRRQQQFAEGIYHLTKAADPTRLISTNDGWEQVTSDLCCIHDYFADGAAFREKYTPVETMLEGSPQGRKSYASGYRYGGEPIILSEYGGISFGASGEADWGYHEDAESEEELLRRIGDQTEAIRQHPRIAGFCYTQLTDVMQETNGLLDADHCPKAPMEGIRPLFSAD